MNRKVALILAVKPARAQRRWAFSRICLTLAVWAGLLISVGCDRRQSAVPKAWREHYLSVGSSEINQDGTVIAGGATKTITRELTAGADLGGAAHSPGVGRHLMYDYRALTGVTSTGVTVRVRIVYADDFASFSAPRKEITKDIAVPFGGSARLQVLPTVYVDVHFEPPRRDRSIWQKMFNSGWARPD